MADVFESNFKHDLWADFLEYKRHVGDYDTVDPALHSEFAGFKLHLVLRAEPAYLDFVYEVGGNALVDLRFQAVRDRYAAWKVQPG